MGSRDYLVLVKRERGQALALLSTARSERSA
jgi:hypothetical protein